MNTQNWLGAEFNLQTFKNLKLGYQASDRLLQEAVAVEQDPNYNAILGQVRVATINHYFKACNLDGLSFSNETSESGGYHYPLFNYKDKIQFTISHVQPNQDLPGYSRFRQKLIEVCNGQLELDLFEDQPDSIFGTGEKNLYSILTHEGTHACMSAAFKVPQKKLDEIQYLSVPVIMTLESDMKTEHTDSLPMEPQPKKSIKKGLDERKGNSQG